MTDFTAHYDCIRGKRCLVSKIPRFVPLLPGNVLLVSPCACTEFMHLSLLHMILLKNDQMSVWKWSNWAQRKATNWLILANFTTWMRSNVRIYGSITRLWCWSCFLHCHWRDCLRGLLTRFEKPDFGNTVVLQGSPSELLITVALLDISVSGCNERWQ